MIRPDAFVRSLEKMGISFYAGVPDSLLKEFCAYVEDHVSHVIAANEGNAVAMACGYHMATGKIAGVYLQNSGLGNIINPLTSLADKEVYKIPMLLIIGWRGEPGIHDEPQHVKQGRITPKQLELLDIPYRLVDADCEPEELASWVSMSLDRTGAPVALLVRNGAFATHKSRRVSSFKATMPREQALDILLSLAGEASVIATTGKTSREVFELRVARNEAQRDFLTVGGMGHTSSIALGAAMGRPEKDVVCIDGDGSALMHMGALAIIGDARPPNLTHVLMNNAAHESVGGQPTVGDSVDFKSLAVACGYAAYALATTPEEIATAWSQLKSASGPRFLEVRIATGSRDDLGRPTNTPVENKQAFMEWIKR
jgi:phosphonopyruvate decarboxylase